MTRNLGTRCVGATALLTLALGCGGAGSEGAAGKDGAMGPAGPAGATGPAGASGTAGPTGASGPAGTPGPSGATGATGATGAAGRDGQGGALIIALQPDDALGTAQDKRVQVTFGGDVTAAASQLANSTITLSYSHREAPTLVADATVCASAFGPGATCFANEAGVRVMRTFDNPPHTGLLEADAMFLLAFDRPLAADAEVRLQDLLDGQVGLADAFRVTQFNAARQAFEVTANVAIPIAVLDGAGLDVGRSFVLPAFALLDQMGNGNALTAFTLRDDLDVATAQKEPEGLPFDPATMILQDSVPEDGWLRTGSRFSLCFDQPMDAASTRGALRARLLALPGWTDVDVTDLNPACFSVEVLADVDLTDTQGKDTLTLERWDVTSAAGITNTNNPIVFVIAETRAPTLAADPDGNTLQVVLAGSVPTRAHNAQLVAGDRLRVRFSEPMDRLTVRTDLATHLGALPNVADVTEAEVLWDGTWFVFTLRNGDTVDIPGEVLALGQLSTADVKDTHGVTLAPNQDPTAKRVDFMTAPKLTNPHPTDTEYTDTVFVSLGVTSPREDDTISAGDTLVFQFDHVMDPATTATGLAQRIATATLIGGTRTGTFDAQSVQFAMQITGVAPLASNRFAYTLTGDQEIRVTGPTLAFGPLDTSVLDFNGLRIEQNQVPLVTRAHVDPAVSPTLVSVTAARGTDSQGHATPCGDALLEAGDVLSFTFSEAMRADQVDAVRAAVATAISAESTGAVTAADVSSPDRVTFRARLPVGTTLGTGVPRRFVLDSTAVVDVHGVAAASAADVTASMNPQDTLDATVEFGNQFHQNDGKLVAGDTLVVTWSCLMEPWDTLSAVQEAVDSLMGDGVAKVKPSAGNRVFHITVLPGHEFTAQTTRTLQVGPVTTNEDPSNLDSRVAHLAGPFPLSFDDAKHADMQLSLVAGSIRGSSALYQSAASIPAGTWFLSATSSQLSRVATEMDVVFGDFDAPPVTP